MNSDNLPQFYTVEGVAKLLKVSKMTILRYIKQEKNPLPVIYLSDQTIRVPVDQFEVWIDTQKGGGKNE